MDNEPSADSLPKRRMHRFLGLRVYDAQHADLRHITQAGKVLQGILHGDRQSLQSLDHEIHNAVGVVLGTDTSNVPYPDGLDGVEREQTLLGQCDHELNREERISAGLLLYEFRERSRTLRRAVQGVGDEPADIAELKRRQHDLMHLAIGLADRLARAYERV